MNQPLFCRYFVLLISSLFCVVCQADIYKQVDAAGIATYSNVKINGAVRLNLELPANQTRQLSHSNNSNNTQAAATQNAMLPNMPTRTASPAGFPKVDFKTQQQRDSTRKSILQTELNDEKVALNDARQAADKRGHHPEHAKNLQADINAHQRNIMLLEKEINAM